MNWLDVRIICLQSIILVGQFVCVLKQLVDVSSIINFVLDQFEFYLVNNFAPLDQVPHINKASKVGNYRSTLFLMMFLKGDKKYDR